MSSSQPLWQSPLSAPASALAVAVALAVLYVVWGSTYMGIRFALEGGWPPLLMAGIRFLVAGSVLFTVLRLRGVPMPTRRQWRNSRSEEHTSELQSLMRISYAVFCLKKKKNTNKQP